MRVSSYDNLVQKLENYGNSVSFYILLAVIGFGIWILTPFAPDWRPSGGLFGIIALVFAGLTMVHGILWFIITREYFKIPKKTKAAIASAIRLVRPLHMMTGMFALGLVLIHGYAYIKTGFGWTPRYATGIAALVVLAVLAIDGIGLMVTPFLSRVIHRWVAAFFVVVLAAHLWLVL